MLVSRSPHLAAGSPSSSNPSFNAAVPFGLLSLQQHLSTVTSCAFSPDGSTLVVCGTRADPNGRADSVTLVLQLLDTFPLYQIVASTAGAVLLFLLFLVLLLLLLLLLLCGLLFLYLLYLLYL